MRLDIRTLQTTIVEALDDIKARDIAVFDTTGGSQEFDRVIVATAEVSRQTRAMAMNVIDKVKQAGGRIVSMEGGDTGEWVLVDCLDAIVHIMQPAVRQYYNLEELWGQKRVKVLTAADRAKAAAAAATKRVIRAAQEKAAALVAQAAAKKAAAKRVAAKNAVVKKPAAKKPAAKKPVAKKPAAKKPAAKKPAAKKPTAKKPAAKKPAARKPSVKNAAVKKPAVAKKAAVKKAR